MSENTQLAHVLQASMGAGYPTGTAMDIIVAQSHPITFADTFADDEAKRTDRQGGEMYVEGFEGGCQIRGSARYGVFNNLWRQLLANSVTAISQNCSNGDCAYTATGNKLVLTSGTWDAAIVAGVPIQVTKTDSGANPLELILVVTERTDSKNIVVAGATLANETPAGAVKIRCNYIKNGTSELYATIEELIESGEYKYLVDAVVSRGAYNVPAKGSVKFEFDMIGRSGNYGTSSISAGDGYNTASTARPIVGDTAVLAIRLDHSELASTLYVTDHNLSVNGAVAPFDAQRHRGPAAFDFDTFQVTSTLSLRRKGAASTIRAHKTAMAADTTPVALMRVDSDRENNRFGWLSGRCRRTGLDDSSGARDNKTVVGLSFTHERHPTWDYKTLVFWFPLTPA